MYVCVKEILTSHLTEREGLEERYSLATLQIPANCDRGTLTIFMD